MLGKTQTSTKLYVASNTSTSLRRSINNHFKDRFKGRFSSRFYSSHLQLRILHILHDHVRQTIETRQLQESLIYILTQNESSGVLVKATTVYYSSAIL